MRFHFIGICGAGMSAVAKLLIDQGHTVTGSDEGFYPPISDYLTTNNIPCTTPFSRENIPSDADYIIIGKHAKLVPEENEEVAEAFATGKKILSFPQALQFIIKDRYPIVVAGSFGKSTCASLLAWCLEPKGVGYFIGAIPLTPSNNASLGTSSLLILEGDEYPSSNQDVTSKFLYYNAHDLILTALAHDHINVFPTHKDYLAPFFTLIETLPHDATFLACIDDATIREKIHTFKTPCVTYGLSPEATWHAENISWGHETSFNLVHSGVIVTSLTTKLLGKHNVQNIIGVCAYILEKGFLSVEELHERIASFEGIIRRLDRKSKKTSIPVYEGFGSSVDKAKSAVEAIKLHFPKHRLVIIFEPHTFSWRNKGALSWYDSVFTGAEKVFIYKPPIHGKDTHEQLSLDNIVARVHASGINTVGFEHVPHGVKLIADEIRSNDVVLILSSGSMDGLLDTLIPAIETLFPTRQ
ncbi:MAG: UDP-N-acetylmuramate: L-alanyl-gamma-D-glutamyl-meso-diaminopimelate ligase [Patescibacteria group bacterium]|nr:UDP-N-acetylmuramate: L-alanyl-gamma-D-glutamyl-meso-diaminopimelate ligase [Patescibacteria group bacterium]